MSILGKRIVVFTMLWVLLVMAVSQIFDNVTGKGMPARTETKTLDITPTVMPDEFVTELARLQSCVVSDPQSLQCALDLADLYYQARQWPHAQVNYERAVQLDPHDVAILLKLAGTYIYQDKFPQAIPTLLDASRLKPESPEIHLLLGLSLSKLDPPQTEAAVAEWSKVVSLDPDSAWATQAKQYIGEVGK